MAKHKAVRKPAKVKTPKHMAPKRKSKAIDHAYFLSRGIASAEEVVDSLKELISLGQGKLKDAEWQAAGDGLKNLSIALAGLRMSIASGDAVAAAWAGMNVEHHRMTVHVDLLFMQDAQRGKTTIRSASKGGQARRTFDPAKAADAKAERDELIRKNKGRRFKTRACEIIGEGYGVGYKTIARL